jgi:hypothetical protein
MALAPFAVENRKGKVLVMHARGDAELVCLSPPLVVRRAYLSGEGTFGKVPWPETKDRSKFEVEVSANTQATRAWLQALCDLVEEAYQGLWLSSKFQRSRDYFKSDHMPPSVRAKVISFVRNGTQLRFRSPLRNGPVPIVDPALRELNDIDNATEHVQAGDRVRVQFALLPYVLNGEKKFGVSLRLQGVILLTKASDTKTLSPPVYTYKGIDYSAALRKKG